MKKVVTYFRFFLLIVKNFNLGQTRADFEKRRRHTLQSLPGHVLPAQVTARPGLYIRLRTFFLKNNLLQLVIANLAFIKNRKRTYRQYFISDSLQLVYIRIFKNASTSILKCLLPEIHKPVNGLGLSDEQLDALATYLVKHTVLATQRHYVHFAVVRNPFKRIVSAYLDIFDPASAFFAYESFLFGIFKKNMSFKEFVTTLASVPDSLRGPHFCSQYTALRYTRPLDEIIIFSIDADRARLESFLKTYHLLLAHQNKAGKSYDYASYYDHETLELVFRLYYIDFKTFNYLNEYDVLKKKIAAAVKTHAS